MLAFVQFVHLERDLPHVHGVGRQVSRERRERRNVDEHGMVQQHGDVAELGGEFDDLRGEDEGGKVTKARNTPVSDTLFEEMAARNWGRPTVAEKSGLKWQVIQDILCDRQVIDELISAALGRAFGLSPGFFYRLQQLHHGQEIE